MLLTSPRFVAALLSLVAVGAVLIQPAALGPELRRRLLSFADGLCTRPRNRAARRSSEPWRSPDGVLWHSQTGADACVFELVGRAVNGTFVEAGAWDGVVFSNTLTLEDTWQWQGVLVEAHGPAADVARRNRPRALTTVHAALTDEDGGEVRFRFLPMHPLTSGLVARPAGRAELSELQEPSAVVGDDTAAVGTVTVSKLLDDVGMPVVDFFSLDIEGGELEALRGVDWHRHTVNILCVEEVDRETPSAIAVRRLLEGLTEAPSPNDEGDGRPLPVYLPPLEFGHDLIYMRARPKWSWR